MDPISQGALGSVFAQTATSKEKLRGAALFGCLAGMAPDLDVFIQSSTDPLLFLEYHRHFTHSLVFIPLGALIVTAVLFRVLRHSLSLREAYVAAFIGYATHGLLDACTSYGTQLFWPFSNSRIAWNNVSVVDPVFTLPLLAFVVTGVVKRNPRIASFGVGWAIFYLCLGVIQHERALAAAQHMAELNGHTPTRLSVKPGFANLILWKSTYEHQGVYYIDAVRLLDDTQWCPGKQIAKLDISKHLPKLRRDSQQAADLERFRWFSDDYLAPFGPPGRIIDVRYSAVPNDIDPLWGIQIDMSAGATAHADFIATRRATSAHSKALMDLLAGRHCYLVPT